MELDHLVAVTILIGTHAGARFDIESESQYLLLHVLDGSQAQLMLTALNIPIITIDGIVYDFVDNGIRPGFRRQGRDEILGMRIGECYHKGLFPLLCKSELASKAAEKQVRTVSRLEVESYHFVGCDFRMECFEERAVGQGHPLMALLR